MNWQPLASVLWVWEPQDSLKVTVLEAGRTGRGLSTKWSDLGKSAEGLEVRPRQAGCRLYAIKPPWKSENWYLERLGSLYRASKISDQFNVQHYALASTWFARVLLFLLWLPLPWMIKMSSSSQVILSLCLVASTMYCTLLSKTLFFQVFNYFTTYQWLMRHTGKKDFLRS